MEHGSGRGVDGFDRVSRGEFGVELAEAVCGINWGFAVPCAGLSDRGYGFAPAQGEEQGDQGREDGDEFQMPHGVGLSACG